MMYLIFPQNCPENPECTVFQDCIICNTMPDGRDCDNVNCTVSMVETSDDFDSETYLIEGSQYKEVYLK